MSTNDNERPVATEQEEKPMDLEAMFLKQGEVLLFMGDAINALVDRIEKLEAQMARANLRLGIKGKK